MQNRPLMLISEWLAHLAETMHCLNKISRLSKLSIWTPLTPYLTSIRVALFCRHRRLNATEPWERHRPYWQERSPGRTVSPINCNKNRPEDCATSHGKALNWPKSWESPFSPPRSKRTPSSTQLSPQPKQRYPRCPITPLSSPPKASKLCFSRPIRPPSDVPPSSSTSPSNHCLKTGRSPRNSSGKRGRKTGPTSGSGKLATRTHRNQVCCKST